MSRPIMDVARELAIAHREYDPATTTIKLFPSIDREIRLLEVSSASPTTGEVLPFRFGADAAQGIDYPSVVIVLSPREWEDVKSHDLPLPTGWSLPEAEDL